MYNHYDLRELPVTEETWPHNQTQFMRNEKKIKHVLNIDQFPVLCFVVCCSKLGLWFKRWLINPGFERLI